jgi:hypothetical protein
MVMKSMPTMTGEFKQQAFQFGRKIHITRLVILGHAAAADGHDAALEVYIRPPHRERILFPCAGRRKEAEVVSEKLAFLVASAVAEINRVNCSRVISGRRCAGFCFNCRVSGSRSIKQRSTASLSTLRTATVSRLRSCA